MPLTLLTGGARSGKSALATRIGAAWAGPVTVIATGEPRDQEMRERIERHRADRPTHWRTIEEPVELADAIASVPPDAAVIVDCLTLWVSNLLERSLSAGSVQDRAADAAALAAARPPPTVVVTNEVGAGIVPADPMTRAYRDLLGAVNAAFARAAERVLLLVAGRAVALAPLEEVIRHVAGG